MKINLLLKRILYIILKHNVIKSLIDHYTVEMAREDQSSSVKQIRLITPSARIIGIGAIFIFLISCLVYTPALKNGFVWDDAAYVYKNASIQSLNLQFFHWILSSFHASNWHPLTWLSLALDYALWGLDAFGYHLTNIILHGLNTLLVFL